MFALIAHRVAIAIWAVLYDACGKFTVLGDELHLAWPWRCGDVGTWKLFGPLEAADGLLMFGVSTAMIFAAI
jgi:hypothetical protein